jgi:hypothetical protein
MKTHGRHRLGPVVAIVFLLAMPVATFGGDSEPAAPADTLDVRALVAELRPQIESLRGRKYLKPVTARILDPMRAMMSPGAMGMKGGPPPGVDFMRMMKSMAAQQLSLAALGVVPESMVKHWIGPDGKLTMGFGGMPPMGQGGCGMPGMNGGEMPTGVLGAFYQQSANNIVILHGKGTPNRELVTQILFHEMTHALDDQHHDLSRFVPGGTYEGDRLEAVRAVVEGSAVNSELDRKTRVESDGRFKTVLENEKLPKYGGYLKADGTPAPREREGLAPHEQRMGPTAAMGKMPAAVGKVMVFPYAYGFEFVKALRAAEVPVDRAFEEPPDSTEQIIHPEKWLAEERDVPVRVSFSSLAALLSPRGVNVLAEQTLGEFQIRCLLEEIDLDRGRAAAAGWDGDRLAVVTRDGKIGFVWASTWDEEREAEEFAAAAREYLERKLPEGKGAVRREGRDVLVVSGLGSEVLGDLDAVKIGEFVS